MALNQQSIAIIFIILIGLFIRITNLSTFPFFTDEAIYAHWAQGFIDGTLSPFISISDGKTPLYVWAIALFVKLGAGYTLAGRMLSASSFLLTALCIYLIARKVIKGSGALLPVLFYAISPFTVFFERLGIMDPLLTAFSTGFIFFMYAYMNAKKYIFASLGASVMLALAYLTKPSALLLGYACFAVPLLCIQQRQKEKALPALLITLPTFLVLLPISRSSGYSAYVFKSQEFVYPLNTAWPILFNNLISNIKNLLPAFYTYFLSFVVLFPIGIYLLAKNKHYMFLFLTFLYFLLPAGVIMVFGRIVFSRYFLSILPLVFIISSYSLLYLFTIRGLAIKVGSIGILLVTLVYFLYGTSKTLLSPSYAFLSTQDRWQYITSTASGFGIDRSILLLRKISGNKNIQIVTTQNFGNLPYYYEFAFENSSTVSIVGTWTLSPSDIRKDVSIKKDTYLVYNVPISQLPTASKKLIQIAQYVRPGNQSAIAIYKLEK